MTEQIDLTKLPELPVIELVDDPVQIYKEIMIVKAALQLGLFDWMDKKNRATVKEISAGTGIKEEYATSFMAILYQFDIVRRADDEYYLSPPAKLHFVRSSSYYQGDIITELGKESSPWYDLKTFLTHPDEKSVFYPKTVGMATIDAEQEIRGMVKNTALAISKWEGFKDAHTFLEMSRGHGLYAITVCQTHPYIKATVVSTPEAERLLADNIASFGMEERIRIIPQITENDRFDIVLASHALYGKNISSSIAEIAKILRENGLFVSNHWFNKPSEEIGMQGLYELELAFQRRYSTLNSQEEFERICATQKLGIFQTGMMRSMNSDSIIHMAKRLNAL
jgi:hypothetical protein